MEKIVGVAQLYFMPHSLLEIVQRLMAHPVVNVIRVRQDSLVTSVRVGRYVKGNSI